MKTMTILGSTGSIGTQALEVAAKHNIKVKALAANSDVEKLAALIGLVGDLTASVIKRQTGIKDYGNIMPGHGGIMDRFDSVLLVAPFMYYMFTQGLILK